MAKLGELGPGVRLPPVTADAGRRGEGGGGGRGEEEARRGGNRGGRRKKYFNGSPLGGNFRIRSPYPLRNPLAIICLSGLFGALLPGESTRSSIPLRSRSRTANLDLSARRDWHDLGIGE